MRLVWLIVTLMGFVGAGPAFGHGGGLDKNGCHTNRKTGDYHCHRAPAPVLVQPQPLVAQPAARRVPQQALHDGQMQPRAAPAAPGRPTCYVGPRGGTYTIAASGRKNYGGC